MTYKLQRSFSAGEVSPQMYLRNDGAWAQMHTEALSIAKNVICDPRGPAHCRGGSEYIEELVGEDYCRLFSMDVAFSKAFAVAVTPNFLYVIDRNGFQISDDVLVNGDFDNGGVGWSQLRTTFPAGTAVMTPNVGNPASLWQLVTTATPLEVHRIKLIGLGPTGGNPYTVKVGSAQGLDDIFTEQNSGFEVSMDFTPGIANFWFQVDVLAGDPTQTFDTLSIQSSVDSGDLVSFPSPYNAQDILELQEDKEPGNETMFFVTRRVPPYELTFSDDGGIDIWDFKLVDFVFDTEAPESGVAPWGDAENPGCISFYSGRMILGGTFGGPVGIWASKPREYRNFDLGDSSAQVATDALYLPLDKHGELVWLKGNKQLFAGLDTGEHVVYGQGGVITGNNAQTEQHSTYGSARIQPQVVNEEIAYVDTRGSKVRLMDYNSDSQTMNSFDISFIAEHLTEHDIIELRYGSSKLGSMYMPTINGELLICWIDKGQKTYGWTQHDTQGQIISITLLKEFGRDVPWIAVTRGGKLFVERLRIGQDIYMDSHASRVELVPTTVFPDFDHLEGETVQVLLDGAVHPDVVVAAGGIVNTDYPGLECFAGLGFTPEIQTLPEMEELKDGTTRAHMKRYSEVDIHLINSPRPIVNGQDTYRRFPSTPMNTREVNRTEIVEITNVGWDQESVINVSQPLPLAMSVAGIGGKIKSGKL